MSTALLIVDIQNDYFSGGRNELHNPEQTAANARKVLEYFRERQLPVLHIQHINLRENATFFRNGTEGARIHASVYPQPDETVIVKHAPDSFLNTGLRSILEQLPIFQLVVCGMMTHMCIDTTVRSAKALGYDILLLGDACATKNLAWNGRQLEAAAVHQVFLAALQNTFAEIQETEQYLENRNQ